MTENKKDQSGQRYQNNQHKHSDRDTQGNGKRNENASAINFNDEDDNSKLDDDTERNAGGNQHDYKTPVGSFERKQNTQTGDQAEKAKQNKTGKENNRREI